MVHERLAKQTQSPTCRVDGERLCADAAGQGAKRLQAPAMRGAAAEANPLWHLPVCASPKPCLPAHRIIMPSSLKALPQQHELSWRRCIVTHCS